MNIDMAPPQLLAIVEVEKAERVYCGRPDCKHTVYKAIHVVRDGGQLMALGSTCFAKRYGSLTALGPAQHGAGKGKLLTTEERALLQGNTEALLALFAAQEAKLRAEAELKLQQMRQRAGTSPTAPTTPAPFVHPPAPQAPDRAQRRHFPWGWMKPNSSVAAFKLNDGSGWVRVQHKDGRQLVVPWPVFEGWDESLPPAVGSPNLEVGGYEAGNVIEAVAYLRARAEREKVTGLWGDVMDMLGPKPEM